jgi:hypothetical protein
LIKLYSRRLPRTLADFRGRDFVLQVKIEGWLIVN